MRINKNDIPHKIDAPGAIARQAVDFGDTSGFSTLGAEYFSLATGTDIAPLLRGLPEDCCRAPHWGFMLAGEVVVTYTHGAADSCSGGDLFYWPPGHSVRVVEDAEVVLFSPQQEHTEVMDHMLTAMAG